jgi:hypothetical protein
MARLVEQARVSAVSTMRPAYITCTRSQRPETTPRSWVMKITAMPSSRCIFLISSRICACTVTSRAVVGSSAISSSGLVIRAIAIITRWRMPPENSCGYSGCAGGIVDADGVQHGRGPRSGVALRDLLVDEQRLDELVEIRR